MILSDTNVILELMRVEPNQEVQAWLEKQAIESLFLSSITLAEIYFGWKFCLTVKENKHCMTLLMLKFCHCLINAYCLLINEWR